jgi:3-hydroxyisobutyrate dehydrogenase-like beta-hydroxyacid dehydrogenase
MAEKIGILHPGAMGVSVGMSARNSGNEIYWVSKGRSAETKERALKAEFADAGTLAQLCESCSIILSVCPPAAAEALAEEVLSHQFKGLYLDANAIAPQRALRIGQKMREAGVSFVDGGIIGGPAWKPNTTWLYLSGETAQTIAECFSAGPLETSVLSENVGDASALKSCYAAYTKGTTALLAAIFGAAEALNVREALENQWSRDDENFVNETHQRLQRVTAKAWRFEGEMLEIADTLDEAGIPSEFFVAAAATYRRLAGFKDAAELPSLEAVLSALLAPTASPKSGD